MEEIITEFTPPEEIKKWKGFFPDGRKLRILVVPANDGGCAYYRAWSPYRKLEELYPNVVDITFEKNPLGMDLSAGNMPEGEPEIMKWADVIVINNISNFGGPYTARICGIAKQLGKFVHTDTDDLLTDLYEGHRLKEVYKDRGLSDITKHVYQHSDLVTVTQHKFAERVAPFCSSRLAVLKNAIDYNLKGWNHPKIPPQRRGKATACRVVWAGGIHHEEDVKEFASVPHLVNSKIGREHVEWKFFGRPPVHPDGVRDWQHDVWDNYERIMMTGFKGHRNWSIHPAFAADDYGIIFSAADIAIAPLQMNAFNDSKSDIKVAECGRYGVPLVASNIGCYSDTIKNGVNGYLLDPKAPKLEWVRILSKLIKDRKLRERLGNNLKSITDEYFDLNNTVHHRLIMYKECFSDKS